MTLNLKTFPGDQEQSASANHHWADRTDMLDQPSVFMTINKLTLIIGWKINQIYRFSDLKLSVCLFLSP